MTKVGITGQAGFVGSHLFNYLGIQEGMECIPFTDDIFDDAERLKTYVSGCDVIVHLAAMNRHPDPEVIYSTNTGLVRKLITALEDSGSKAHVIFSSSTQEELDNLYGKSKKEGREMLEAWAGKSGGRFTGLVIPNVFGPFGKPFYNSFVATFCYLLTHDGEPEIHVDSEVKLIYVNELIAEIFKVVRGDETPSPWFIPYTSQHKVTYIRDLLLNYRDLYFRGGIIPELNSPFEINLFNTYRSFIDPAQRFPIKLTQHTDNRGTFVETIRLGTGGQVSFSTTKPGITRGNHFHTRKIERFAVIRGKASIELRQIGTSHVHRFYLDGNEPSYVDMPVWVTHNITNVGDEELLTIFWINEWFNPEDPDTWFETV